MLKISNLSKNFGTGAGAIKALQNVSLSLATGGKNKGATGGAGKGGKGKGKGNSLALVGATAAGKSVLLKCLAGLYPPSSGTIEIDGQIISSAAGGSRSRGARPKEINQKIGMLFQQNALFDSLTVWENIAFRLIADGMGRRQAREEALKTLPKIGLSEDVGALFPADLSGGMQKRVGFARAIITNPTILLLDNPTAGLDPILAARIDRMIARLADESGATVISVTSNMVGIYDAYHEIAVMDSGIVQWHGTSAEAKVTDNIWVRQILAGQREGPIKVLAS